MEVTSLNCWTDWPIETAPTFGLLTHASIGFISPFWYLRQSVNRKNLIFKFFVANKPFESFINLQFEFQTRWNMLGIQFYWQMKYSCLVGKIWNLKFVGINKIIWLLYWAIIISNVLYVLIASWTSILWSVSGDRFDVRLRHHMYFIFRNLIWTKRFWMEVH